MSRALPSRRHALSCFAVGLAVAAVGACSDSSATDGGSPSASPSASTTSTPPAWGYDTGLEPSQWGSAYPACADSAGTTGSPIDIAVASLGAVDTADPVELDLTSTYWRVFNNGHTVEAVPVTQDGKEAEGAAGTVTIAGEEYTVAQFHLHAPSEHTFDGQPADMEMHVVTKSDDGDTSVIGLPLTVGDADLPLDVIFAAVPTEVTAEDDGILTTGELNLADVLPTDAQVARYTGSLTTPPCTGGVLWDVYTTPVTVSAEQADVFAALYTHNARPVQPLHERTTSARTVVSG